MTDETAAENTTIDEVLATPDNAANLSPAERSDGGRPSALTTSEANDLAGRRRCTVVVLAGGVGSGKTSIYASLYERLGRGPFAGWIFAGSKTIPGLERRCHWWRTSSGGEMPDMEHTQAGALPWLHLRIRDVELRHGARDLLLGDFDGEIFDAVVNRSARASDLPWLYRADHVGIVINGAKLANQTERADERQQCEYLLENLIEASALATPTTLSLLVTKIDLFESLPPEQQVAVDECLHHLNSLADRLTRAKVPQVRLAVRSSTPSFPLGHGAELLLELFNVRGTVHVEAPPAHRRAQSALAKFTA